MTQTNEITKNSLSDLDITVSGFTNGEAIITLLDATPTNYDDATNIKKIWYRNLPDTSLPDLSQYIPTTDESTDSPLLENEPGSRATAGGGKYRASGQSTAGRRGIEKKHAKSLINQQLQKRLPA